MRPGRLRQRAGMLLVTVLSLAAVVACGSDNDDPTATAAPAATLPSDVPTSLSGNLTIFAAASLTAAFTELQAQLEGANPGLSIIFNFAGSQQLATQLAEGAGADVFASANSSQMRAAQDAGRISGEPVIFARNRLAVIMPADNPAGLETPTDLANAGVKLVIANPDVPVGQYTLDMLDNLSADPEFGADFRQRVEGNVVSQEDNVRQVVTKVQLGEADAGVVYVTDVTQDVVDEVRLIEIPEQFNVIAEYPVAAVEGGDAELAQAFIDYLVSAGGQAVLEQYGFTPIE